MDSSERFKHGRRAEITSDGRTVWVNSGVNGANIGRFNVRSGIDIHKPPDEQMESGTQCLHCSPEPDWEEFVSGMAAHYGIPADAFRKHRPKQL